jgi:glycosyltransferase involved in cell wall biosynthesis
MRICHLTVGQSLKDARIYYRICYGLAERGQSVVLIAPEAPIADAVVQLSQWNLRLAQTKRVLRVGLALRAALAENATIYHLHGPELIPLGLVLKTLRPSAAVVFDAREDYPAMMRVKYWVSPPLRPLLAKAASMMNFVAGLCLDGIVAADPDVQKDFQQWRARWTFVYYNFPTLSLFRPDATTSSRAKADLVYIGGMSDRTGMFVLLDALTLLAREGVRPTVRLAGYTDGEAGRTKIQEGIVSRGLEAQVELRGQLSYSEVPAWIRSGRIGLVPLQAIPKFMKNISTKTFEYWACGLPVIASDLPPIRPFLADGKNGLLFDPSSSRDLARAIRSLVESPHLCDIMGRNGQEQVYKLWNNESQADGLISFYEQICSR